MNKKSKIKKIKHQIKNGKLKVRTIDLDTSFDQAQELAFLSVMGTFLEEHGIKQDAISFLDEAMAGDKKKRAIATGVAESFKKSIDDAGITSEDIKSVKLVNIDAYESPEQFLEEEGLIRQPRP